MVFRLRRILAMTTVLLSLLTGLSVASAQADAPVLTGGGGRQTPRVAKQTPGITPSSTTSTPLPSPSVLQATTPLSPTASPVTPSSTTGTLDSTNSVAAKSSEKTDDQDAHEVHFDPADGSTPTKAAVKTGSLATSPEKNPQREDFRFDGWTLDGQPYDFQTPVLRNITLKAQWSKITDWTLSPDHGPASGARLTISPPDKQEPRFSNIHAAGDQTVGLTGDGRIYIWMQESTPKQVPFPTHTADGFHYLQAAAGSHWDAALGSDQQIYTWTSAQATPTILNTDQNTGFTSISMHDDQLLAVDRQGQVHLFQTDPIDNQSIKPTEQVATSLPGKAQAILAAASNKRILILDADGQAWTWETSKIGKAEPARVKQDQGRRIIQAAALNQGFLLAADGQAWYLADGTTNMNLVGLPDGAQTSWIIANEDQALITDTEGRVWTWKPSETPMRVYNGNQQYVQAANVGSKITAIDKHGSILTWSLDAQGQLSKPVRLNTTQAPTLESASMDSQPLKLTGKNHTWQADAPAHKPGPTTITLVGRHDDQTFTKSLQYTVDQPLTRDTETETSYTVYFNTGEGDPTPSNQKVSYPYGRVQRPSPDPARQGYLFDGWFIKNVAYDFSKPVTDNLTLTAKWTPKNPGNTWKINPDKGGQLGGQQTTITPPANISGIKFNQISSSKSTWFAFSLAVGSDGNAYAWGNNDYGQLGDGTTTQRDKPVVVKKPDPMIYTNLPNDFTYVQVSAGDGHSLALGSDGYVYAWGDNTYGQLGNNTNGGYSTAPLRVRDPATSSNATTGLKSIQVSAGGEHSLAIDANGSTWAWGRNHYGQLGNGTSSASNVANSIPVRAKFPITEDKEVKVIQASAGYEHSLAIDNEGNTWAWGYNRYGQLGNGDSSTNTAPTLVQYPKKESGSVTAVQVSAGGWHSLAIDTDGQAWAWGYNYYGQLGNGSTSGKNANSLPASVQFPTTENKEVKVIQASAGFKHSLAIDEEGRAWAWGSNEYGQLGNNTTNDQHSPVKVFASTQSTSSPGPCLNATQISSGGWHSLAIDEEGSARTWGYNYYGQLGNPDAGSRSLAPVPVVFNLQPVITGITFDRTVVKDLPKSQDDGSVTVVTPAHEPGTVTVSVDYTLGGAAQKPDTTLRYTYTPLGVLPQAGGEGILLALTTGMIGMGGVIAARRYRREQRQLSHASHE